MSDSCNQSECTFAQTSICVLNNDVSTCPNIIRAETVVDGGTVENKPNKSVEKASLGTSFTLSPKQVSELMAQRYCEVIGILGSPDAGKTGALVSLFLMLSHNQFPGYEFRDSKSLMAFEEISRGARRWNKGDHPEQMTSHTRMSDERVAGFLHLRLKEIKTDRFRDFLLPDLPGEWTDSLITQSRFERLNFLKSADKLWLMIDGEALLSSERRLGAIHKMKVLLQRLHTLLEEKVPETVFVITRLDSGCPEKGHVQVIIDEADKLGITNSTVNIASFSIKGGVPAGQGVAELFRKKLPNDYGINQCAWPEQPIVNERAFSRYRSRYGEAQ